MFDENRKNGIERFAITVDQNGFAKTWENEFTSLKT